MNREILFKAKRKDNGEWVEGNLITNEINENQKYIGYIFDERNGVIEDFDLVEVIPETICQYTGLDDKNGEKIWENDILHRAYHAEEDCIVQWHDGSYRFKTIHGSYRQDPMTFLSLCFTEKMVCNLKVIGNVFDNPESVEVERC